MLCAFASKMAGSMRWSSRSPTRNFTPPRRSMLTTLSGRAPRGVRFPTCTSRRRLRRQSNEGSLACLWGTVACIRARSSSRSDEIGFTTGFNSRPRPRPILEVSLSQVGKGQVIQLHPWHIRCSMEEQRCWAGIRSLLRHTISSLPGSRLRTHLCCRIVDGHVVEIVWIRAVLLHHSALPAERIRGACVSMRCPKDAFAHCCVSAPPPDFETTGSQSDRDSISLRLWLLSR